MQIRMLLGAMGALAFCTSTAHAGNAERFMPVGAQVAAPRGYLEFCARARSECPELKNDGVQLAGVSERSAYWSLLFSAAKPSAITAQAGYAAAPQWNADQISAPAPKSDRPVVALTPQILQTLNEVNQRVNTAITPRSDMAVYGVEDYWAEPLENSNRYGDCEDFVLEKRRALIRSGFAPAMLSIALVRTAWREDHAVLLVNTDQGELVLDNLSPYVSSWRTVSYRWLSRQSPTDPSVWVAGEPQS
jgi:predicted transglutaminase-like cysteine proteinase